MDIKDRLESIDLFEPQSATGKNRIISLNNKGIFTVEDFINCDIDGLTKTSYIRREYKAIQHVLRYKYKGEPLVLDVLLDKSFSLRRSDVMGLTTTPYFNAIEKSFRRIGLGGLTASHIAIKLAKEKMVDNHDFYSYDAVDGKFKKDKYEVLVIDILKHMAQKGSKLAKFYVEYQEKKELEERQQHSPSEHNSSEVLENLKSTIVLLTSQRDALDEKIRQLTEQVQTLEGGSIVNGRK